MLRLKTACERLAAITHKWHTGSAVARRRTRKELCEETEILRNTITAIVTAKIDLLWQAHLSLQSVGRIIEMTSDDTESGEPEYSAADVFEAVCNLGEVPDLSDL